MSKEAIIDKIDHPSLKLLPGGSKKPTISVYNIKRRILVDVLSKLELKDVKDLAEYLGLKRGGNKGTIIKRIWLSDKIKSIAFITE